MGFFAGSYTKKTYTIAQLSGLTTADHVGRTYFVSDLNALAFTDGTSWFYTAPINALDQNSTTRALAAEAGKTLAQQIGQTEYKIFPSGEKAQILHFDSRQAFMSSLANTPTLGPLVAAQFKAVRFERYYTGGPQISLFYRVHASLPIDSETDPTVIPLVAGGAVLVQKYEQVTHLHQLGFRFNGTDEGALFNTVAEIPGIRTLECPANATLSTGVRLILPADRALICRGGEFKIQVLADSPEAATTDKYALRIGHRAVVEGITVDAANTYTGGFQVHDVTEVVLDRCAAVNTIKSNALATSVHGFSIQGTTDVVLYSPRVYRANTGVYASNNTELAVHQMNIDTVATGCSLIGSLSRRNTITGGNVRNCSNVGIEMGGGDDNTISEVTVQRCNLGELSFVDSGTANSTSNCRFIGCNVTREASYSSFDGSSLPVDETKGSIYIKNVDSGSRGSGVFNCHFRVQAGQCWTHHVAGTSGSPSTDRSLTIKDCTFTQENAGTPFEIVTNAHSFMLINNHFKLFQVLTSGTLRDPVRCQFVGNTFEVLAEPYAFVVSITRTKDSACLFADNVFRGCGNFSLYLYQFSTHDTQMYGNVFSQEPVTRGGVFFAQQTMSPRYMGQVLHIGTIRKGTGTSETYNFLANFDLLTNIFPYSTNGPMADARVTFRVLGTNNVNSYDIQIGSITGDTIGYRMNVVQSIGSGSGINQNTSLYIDSIGTNPLPLQFTLVKPAGSVIVTTISLKLVAQRY